MNRSARAPFKRLCWLLVAAVVPLHAAPVRLLSWNVAGNGQDDWSTNSVQVQAIGRIIRHLDPDIITFQEIPYRHSDEMTNFVAAFRPGFHLARYSGTDGFIRSMILSRFPINREQKWLDGVLLDDFGYDGRFTRDLFEAEIAVPDWNAPLHVFTTHLKSGFDAASVQRRGAEALAISNFVVNTFLPNHPERPYVLTGDFNEDEVLHAQSGSQVAGRLTHPDIGLRLTFPTNSVSGSGRTFSARGSLASRLDYILPDGRMHSNVIGGEVFRTAVLSPLPENLAADDDRTASDHLPVLMVFRNPQPQPFEVSITANGAGQWTLDWNAEPGWRYSVSASTNLTNWSVVTDPIEPVGERGTWNFDTAAPATYFRVEIVP